MDIQFFQEHLLESVLTTMYILGISVETQITVALWD